MSWFSNKSIHHCSQSLNSSEYFLSWSLLWIGPHFLFFYFLYSFSVMWSSCDHFVTYCSCDIHCSITSIVLWPIVQNDSIVPVMPIVLVTLLFSFTISTSSLWPYSLRLDFLYLMVLRAIRALSPTHPLSLSSQGICSKAPDCQSGYHSHQNSLSPLQT